MLARFHGNADFDSPSRAVTIDSFRLFLVVFIWVSYCLFFVSFVAFLRTTNPCSVSEFGFLPGLV